MIVEKKHKRIVWAYKLGFHIGKVIKPLKIWLDKAFDKFFDIIEWDVKNHQLFLIVAIAFLLAGSGLPDLFTWQFWSFFVGYIIVMIGSYRKGSHQGMEITKKFMEENFVMIPKKELIRQAEMAEQMQRRINKKKKDDDDKLPN